MTGYQLQTGTFMRHPETGDQPARVESKARKAANNDLHRLTFNRYHDGLALDSIDTILVRYGFDPLEDAIYCGRDGSVHEQVGAKTWISLTWHKMTSGRYEIVVYLS
jgi:hypothetical protein